MVAQTQQRFEREARVARPGEAVVPVHVAAEAFRERRRGSRDDRAGRRVDEQLQHERAADDLFAPGAVVSSLAGPARPEGARALEPLLDPRAGREDDGIHVGEGDREERRRACLRDELADEGPVFDARLARVEALERERVVRAGGEEAARAAVDLRGGAAVGEAGLEPPAHAHTPREPFDPSCQLAQRCETVVGQREGVGDANDAARGAVRGDEDVRVLLVRALGLERLIRSELEEPATAAVEDPREDRRRVDVRQAEPVDRAVGGDEGGRATVADHRVLADRRIACEPLHERQSSQQA